MYRSLLVPLDGSHFGEHALPLAVSVAQRAGASLQLVHVQAPLAAVYAEGPLFLDDALLAQLQARQRSHHQTYLDGVAQRVKDVAPNLKVTTALLEGDVPAHIRDQTAAAKADLVVMATHYRGAIARFWLGSVTDDLIRHAAMPLLLAHGTDERVTLTADLSWKHMLVPLDGSPFAEQILPAASGLAKLMGAEITLLRVIKPVLTTGYPMAPGAFGEMAYTLMDQIQAMQGKLKEEATAYLEKIAGDLRQRGFTVHIKVDVDEASAHAILTEAVPPAIDLLAVTTHGRHGLKRFFLGSVTERIVHNATVPVLVHRPQ